ncbi:MAG: hypothetical protein E7231_05230 [Cellulosilyticum sp.]|nr:hypothetical protein [Cellulosilyticum sp.]
MEVRWAQDGDIKITELKAEVEKGQVKLTFKWPNTLENLYIYKQSVLEEQPIQWEKPYRKYTRDEYARFGGWSDPDLGSAMSKYILCPYIQEGAESYVLNDLEHLNEIEVIGHQIEIRYEIKEKKKLWSSRKLIQMQVFCEVPVPRQYLNYVKKKGSIPVGLKDGMCFEFIVDFEAGEQSLPEIEVDKDEYIRIYLTDAVPYKEAYRIIKS